MSRIQEASNEIDPGTPRTKLYHLRRAAGFSQMQMAVKLGVGLKKVLAMERDFESQKLSEIRKVAGTFDISVADLLEGCIEQVENGNVR